GVIAAVVLIALMIRAPAPFAALRLILVVPWWLAGLILRWIPGLWWLPQLMRWIPPMLMLRAPEIFVDQWRAIDTETARPGTRRPLRPPDPGHPDHGRRVADAAGVPRRPRCLRAAVPPQQQPLLGAAQLRVVVGLARVRLRRHPHDRARVPARPADPRLP